VNIVKKPTKTSSGVAVVAVMSSPAKCPHGRCVPCPGGPESIFESPQSYTGLEPAARRGRESGFDPYVQCVRRLSQLEKMGHPITKVKLIVMGGTFTARPLEYQRWFVGEALRAMNEYVVNDGEQNINTQPRSQGAMSESELERIKNENADAGVRCVGITLETRPDWADEKRIDDILSLGTTKVEIGVQSIYEDVLARIKRGHGVKEVIEANRALRDSCLKVGFHIMPGLPGSSLDRDVEMMKELFSSEDFRPDHLKIYPTLVLEDTELYEWWKKGEYKPFDIEDGIEFLCAVKQILPPWVRISRIQRDIPSNLVVAGIKKSNLRQIVKEEMKKRGLRCRCIRCREVGYYGGKVSPELRVESYEVCGGVENFISYEDVEKDVLVGFLRLRYPCSPHRPELTNSALVRELHVYGRMVDVGKLPSDKEWQHRGAGAMLLERAEMMAEDEGFKRIAVMSGVGVRRYYESLGYRREGPYMVKDLG